MPNLRASSRGRSADTPDQKIVVDEHRTRSLSRDCGAVAKGTFPKDVNARVQQCPRLTGTVSCPHACQHPPLRRNSQAIKDMFGIAISEGP